MQFAYWSPVDSYQNILFSIPGFPSINRHKYELYPDTFIFFISSVHYSFVFHLARHSKYLLKPYIESEEENFVIGGATIYSLLMPYTEKMYITHIAQDFEGDVFFPEINPEEWQVIERQKGLKDEKNPYDYEYVTYVRNFTKLLDKIKKIV